MGHEYLLDLAQEGSVNLYRAAMSYSQSIRARAGSFFEKLWLGYLRSKGFNVLAQPPSLTDKRADIGIDDHIIIDTTTSNRERLKNKVLYLECYPNKELHLISGDNNPPSKSDIAMFISKGVHLIVRDIVYQRINNDSPLIHSYSTYVDEIRISNC